MNSACAKNEARHATAADEMTRQRWQHEIEFFDADAASAAEATALIDPLAIARYSKPRLKKRFDKEFRIHLLGQMQGKTILDLGCGYGGNAVLLATLGARVTGIDISPKSIELATERAAANGVAERTNFVCAPIGTSELGNESFDVIWGDNILHHLIDDLDAVMATLVKLVRRGGMLVFSEPVNLNRALRRFRLMLPVNTEATPDERPLERQELQILKKHVPRLHVRYFDLFGRLNRLVLTRQNYERSSAVRRFVWNGIACTDSLLLKVPGFRNLAGQAVMWAKIGG